MQCFKCFKFMHQKSRCNKDEICGHCSGPKHGVGPCTFPAKCTSCGGGHPSWDRSCPRYIKELEIKKLMVVNKMPYNTARQMHSRLNPFISSKPFSQVIESRIKISTHSSSTQTEPWPAPISSDASRVEPNLSHPAPRPTSPLSDIALPNDSSQTLSPKQLVSNSGLVTPLPPTPSSTGLPSALGAHSQPQPVDESVATTPSLTTPLPPPESQPPRELSSATKRRLSQAFSSFSSQRSQSSSNTRSLPGSPVGSPTTRQREKIVKTTRSLSKERLKKK